MLYNNLSGYFRKKYGQRLKKICIDGGFSCPNRDGKCGTGGCIFCGERGSGEHIEPKASISQQVAEQLSRATEKDKFVAYFQNFTNTYADTETLKARYDSALTDDRIVALAIGTRPDCIDEEKAELITEYKKRVDVWVELGLQTSRDDTAMLINRGYNTEVFSKAVKILQKHEIPVVAHIIVGLPGETGEDAKNTAKFITSLGIDGIKIHSIYVMSGTRLEKMYKENLYTPPSLNEYVITVVDILAELPEDTVVHRLTGDCPKDMLVAPLWNSDKYHVIECIENELKRRGARQGSMNR